MNTNDEKRKPEHAQDEEIKLIPSEDNKVRSDDDNDVMNHKESDQSTTLPPEDNTDNATTIGIP